MLLLVLTERVGAAPAAVGGMAAEAVGVGVRKTKTTTSTMMMTK